MPEGVKRNQIWIMESSQIEGFYDANQGQKFGRSKCFSLVNVTLVNVCLKYIIKGIQSKVDTNWVINRNNMKIYT